MELDSRDDPKHYEQKVRWAGVPWKYRYSDCVSGSKYLLKAIKQIDPLLDLKFYRPTEKWHVVRYPYGRSGQFVKVWECSDNPALGLRDGLGWWIIDALKAGDLRGAAIDRIKEMDLNDIAAFEAKDRELAAQSRDFAAEIRKPLQQLYDYGEASETHYVHPVS